MWWQPPKPGFTPQAIQSPATNCDMKRNFGWTCGDGLLLQLLICNQKRSSEVWGLNVTQLSCWRYYYYNIAKQHSIASFQQQLQSSCDMNTGFLKHHGNSTIPLASPNKTLEWLELIFSQLQILGLFMPLIICFKKKKMCFRLNSRRNWITNTAIFDRRPRYLDLLGVVCQPRYLPRMFLLLLWPHAIRS